MDKSDTLHKAAGRITWGRENWLVHNEWATLGSCYQRADIALQTIVSTEYRGKAEILKELTLEEQNFFVFFFAKIT